MQSVAFLNFLPKFGLRIIQIICKTIENSTKNCFMEQPAFLTCAPFSACCTGVFPVAGMAFPSFLIALYRHIGNLHSLFFKN